MFDLKRKQRAGFVLIEALIALLIVSIGLLAVSRLQSISISGAGESKSRSEAAALSQQKLEELRNMVLRSTFTAAPMVTGTGSVTGTNATYAMNWTVSTPNAGLEQRMLQLSTTWTDRQGIQQRLDLNSLIAWDDPGAQASLTSTPKVDPVTPTGAAKRSNENFGPNVGISNPDGTKIHHANNRTYLLKANGDGILYLNDKDGVVQSFTTITGKIFFDLNAGNSIPNSNNVRIRISSEGECIYDNSVGNLVGPISSGSNSYKYFSYTCYAGAGWYGNVGVVIDETVNGQAGDPTVCVGDPAFNSGVSNSTLISAHPFESATRTYRGFKGTFGAYFSTGVAGGRKYGLSASNGVSVQVAPFDGRPLPSEYPSFYPSMTAQDPNNYFEQNYLLTRITGNGSCSSKMTGGAFARNAGKYFCINPDNDQAADVCPPIWPGFEGEVGTGGAINYTLTVAPTGNGTGTVTSLPVGVSCGAVCSSSFPTGTSVTMTAVAATGSTFSGWSGCDSTSGATCTVAMTGARTTVPTFGGSSTNSLSVSKTGTGAGTVTSSETPLPSISCGATCSASYAAGSTVTLTATPTSGTFTSWTGCTLTTGNTCTATVTGAITVTASFAAANTFPLSVAKAGTGTGTVTSSPGGISCGASCSAAFASGAVVALTAAPTAGSSFTGWTGACTGSSSCAVSMDAAKSVTATFASAAVCTTPVSGAAHDKFGDVIATGQASGSCSMGGGNSSNYSCSLTAPAGTVMTLTNSRTSGNVNTNYNYSLTVTADCASHTNVNFP